MTSLPLVVAVAGVAVAVVLARVAVLALEGG
jgi:hypothetical protein